MTLADLLPACVCADNAILQFGLVVAAISALCGAVVMAAVLEWWK